MQNQAYFREHKDYSSGPDFRFVPLTRLGALSSAVRSTEAVVENYREQIDNSAYDDIALSYYGNKYQTYREQISSVCISDLKGGVENDNFMEILSDYLIGICPAFCYGVNL